MSYIKSNINKNKINLIYTNGNKHMITAYNYYERIKLYMGEIAVKNDHIGYISAGFNNTFCTRAAINIIIS